MVRIDSLSDPELAIRFDAALMEVFRHLVACYFSYGSNLEHEQGRFKPGPRILFRRAVEPAKFPSVGCQAAKQHEGFRSVVRSL